MVAQAARMASKPGSAVMNFTGFPAEGMRFLRETPLSAPLGWYSSGRYPSRSALGDRLCLGRMR
jgi:hypothetical protein